MNVTDRAYVSYPSQTFENFMVIDHTVQTVKTVLLEKADTLDSVNARTTARVLRGIVQEVFDADS